MESVDNRAGLHVLDDLARLGAIRRAILFLRHAERPAIAAAGEGNDVPLTPNGRDSARRLGELVPKTYRLTCSHTGLRRTVETAECICGGFEAAGGKPSPPRSLRSPFSKYVVDDDGLYAIANALCDGFVGAWLSGQISPTVVEPPRLAVRHLLARALDAAGFQEERGECELHVHVCHDWDVYALRGVLLSISPSDASVGFLGGIVVEVHESGLHAAALGRCARVPVELDPRTLLPSCTVVMPTAGRRDGIERTLAGIALQSQRPQQVLVVGDGAPDDTRNSVQSTASSSGLDVEWLTTAGSSGPAAARNVGIEAATTGVLAFTDDDCEPHTEWLQRHLERLLVAPEEVAGSGGRVVPGQDDALSGFFTYHRVLEPPEGLAYLVTANAAFRRDWVLDVGGFDDRLRNPGGEDTELSFRIALLGGTFVYEPRAIVTHHYRTSLTDFARTFFGYGAGGRYCADLLFPPSEEEVR